MFFFGITRRIREDCARLVRISFFFTSFDTIHRDGKGMEETRLQIGVYQYIFIWRFSLQCFVRV